MTESALMSEHCLDPLPSWNDGRRKRTILQFVQTIATDGSPDYVPPVERIAVFDNDGTLWCEQPIDIQIAFAIDRVGRSHQRIRSGLGGSNNDAGFDMAGRTGATALMVRTDLCGRAPRLTLAGTMMGQTDQPAAAW
jgi:hypothetical protein